ncbi:MAG TPA: polysaccharide export protein [Gammaproteobacteria bacterium]
MQNKTSFTHVLAVPSLSLLFALSVLFTLAACTIPGSHLTTSGKEIVGEAPEDVLDSIEVHPINVGVLQELKVAELTGPVANPQLDDALAGYQYRVGKGDVLNITVWDHPELTIPQGQFRSSAEAGNWVDTQGNIFYPYIGEVHVEGKTLEEIRATLAKRLSTFIEKPQVDVNIAAFRAHKVFITGEIYKPGTIPVTNVPMTLVDAINQAGGLNEKADWQRVILHRDGKDEVLSLKALLQKGVMTQNRLMMPGDIAHVASIEDRKVYVMGSVTKPGTFPISRNGMSLTEALSNAGGFKEIEADATGVFVVRRFPEGAEKLGRVYQLDLSDATAMMLGVEFPMQADDVVYVTTAPISRWARIINQIFPTILTIDIIDSLGQ